MLGLAAERGHPFRSRSVTAMAPLPISPQRDDVVRPVTGTCFLKRGPDNSRKGADRHRP